MTIVVRRAARGRDATWSTAWPPSAAPRSSKPPRDAHVRSEMEDGRARVTIETPQRSVRAAAAGASRRASGRQRRRRRRRAGSGARARAAMFARRDRRTGLEPPNGRRGSSCCSSPDGSRVLLDAAHNPEGARALRRTSPRGIPNGRRWSIGIMRDKDADAILRELLPVTSSVIATAAQHAARHAGRRARGARQSSRCGEVLSSHPPTPRAAIDAGAADEPNGLRRGLDFSRRRGPRASPACRDEARSAETA